MTPEEKLKKIDNVVYEMLLILNVLIKSIEHDELELKNESGQGYVCKLVRDKAENIIDLCDI